MIWNSFVEFNLFWIYAIWGIYFSIKYIPKIAKDLPRDISKEEYKRIHMQLWCNYIMPKHMWIVNHFLFKDVELNYDL